MDESDVAYRLLAGLETTLTGVRGRLADLALLSAQGPGFAAPRAELAPEVLPSAEQLCEAAAPGLPQPLVLPPQVDAPPVALPAEEEAPADDGARAAS